MNGRIMGSVSIGSGRARLYANDVQNVKQKPARKFGTCQCRPGSQVSPYCAPKIPVLERARLPGALERAAGFRFAKARAEGGHFHASHGDPNSRPGETRTVLTWQPKE